MATTDRCPKCGALVLPTENYCTQCGAPLVAAPEPATAPPPVGTAPRTIEELRAFCAVNEMPLEKMRFFIDQDYRQPRAFGIYRDGDGFVVYKNKADGSRAVRYHGPDEAWAVKELYNKLLDECHSRGIYPDGKPQLTEEQIRAGKRKKRLGIIVVMLVIVVVAALAIVGIRSHRNDGYYRADGGYYYNYSGDWYYTTGYSDWYEVDVFPYDNYEDYYVGSDYERNWGVEDFKDSALWESIREESHTSSSDYDSWDSGGTDWSSDW